MRDIITTMKRIELEQLNKGEVYPCTILMDRYGGTYSGGKWIAFNLYDNDLPEEVGCDDPTEMMFYRDGDGSTMPIGRGDTPNEAYENLLSILKERLSK